MSSTILPSLNNIWCKVFEKIWGSFNNKKTQFQDFWMIQHDWYCNVSVGTIQYYLNMQYQADPIHYSWENGQKLWKSFKNTKSWFLNFFCTIYAHYAYLLTQQLMQGQRGTSREYSCAVYSLFGPYCAPKSDFLRILTKSIWKITYFQTSADSATYARSKGTI